jgi:hypothetical protein
MILSIVTKALEALSDEGAGPGQYDGLRVRADDKRLWLEIDAREYAIPLRNICWLEVAA